MFFSDIYKSPRSPLSKLRHNMGPPPLAIPMPDYDADLFSRDKVKQKDAVKRYLADKVRNDWEFVWPPAPKPTQIVPDHPLSGAVDPAIASASVQDPVVDDDNGTLDVKPLPSLLSHSTDQVLRAGGEPEGSDSSSDADSDEDRESDDDAASVYSTVSEDPLHFRPRMEWVSDISDDEGPHMSLSPFRFDTPEAIGAAVKASVAEKRARRRRALREEMKWNQGLACFEARRDAWTGARTVHVRAKPVSPTTSFSSSLSPRRLFFRSSGIPNPPAPSSSPQSPTGGNAVTNAHRTSNEGSDVSSERRASKDGAKDLAPQQSQESSARSSTSPSSAAQPSPSSAIHPVETLLPIPPPLLPPANPMRASITPAVYLSLYEKVIIHALTPSCPINLSDMIRACVTGWKRDGEWPPRPSVPEAAGIVAVRRKKKVEAPGDAGAPQSPNTTRRLSLSFLSRGNGEKTEDAAAAGSNKGIRRSIQRVLGITHHGSTSPIAGNAHAYGA